MLYEGFLEDKNTEFFSEINICDLFYQNARLKIGEMSSK